MHFLAYFPVVSGCSIDIHISHPDLLLFFNLFLSAGQWARFTVVVLVSVQGVQNGGPHFQFTRFEGTPFLVYALARIYEIFFMIISLL